MLNYAVLQMCSFVSLQVLRRDLVKAMRRKRPGLDFDQVILHQDNAPPHRAQSTLLDIDLLGFERLQHSPYSPDLAPMDFDIFPRLKKELRGIRHESRRELELHVQEVVRNFNKQLYRSVYDKWVHRHQRCIDCKGEYFEKR